MTDTPWKAGQKAVIDRREIVTIDRVTPTGRAVVGERTFRPSGYALGNASGYLELLTPDVEAEMALTSRGRKASGKCFKLLLDAEKFLRAEFSAWRPRVPEQDAVERAERLEAALRAVLENV